MTKDISVPHPPVLAGFGKVDYKSSKKLHKVEPQNVSPPSLCLPKARMYIKMNLLSKSATPCNTTQKKKNCL